MLLSELIDKARHHAAVRDETVALPGKPAGQAGAAAGYFQLRLSEMRLTDSRRWFSEIVPATFFLADFTYGKDQVRHPFFVSNGLLSGLPGGVDGGKLRTNFRNTLVLGPTPYMGGDVALFVGLFQTTIDDRLKSAFSILEKLFGAFAPGAMSSYLKLAEQLAGEISACLGDTDLKCLLADRSVIGTHAMPDTGYLAYLRASGKPVNKEGLTVEDDTLMRKVGDKLVAVDDTDFCLVKVEQMAQRNDYASMAFHATFEEARKKMLARQTVEAQALMLECAYQVLGSPDLSEDHKAQLIEFYQAKLLAVQSLLGAGASASADATRSGAASAVGRMQERANAPHVRDAKVLSAGLSQIAGLSQLLTKEARPSDEPVAESHLAEHLRTAATRSGPRASAATLVRAIAVGTVGA